MIVEVQLTKRALLDQVAKVIGREKAYKALLDVYLGRLRRGRVSQAFFDERLVYAFDWEASPQGREFWQEIHNKLTKKVKYYG